MEKEKIIPISSALSKPMETLFRVGGFALSFGFAGFFLMILAVFTTGSLKIPMFVVGAVLTSVCLAFFLYSSLRTRPDLPLLDALQQTAYQTAELAALTQSFAFKHLEKIQRTIEVVAPMIESLPIVGPAAKRAGLTSGTRLSSAIVAATEGSKATVLQLQEAIRKGEPKDIRRYGKQLSQAVDNLKVALRQQPDAQVLAETRPGAPVAG